VTLDEAVAVVERQFTCHEWQEIPPGDARAFAPTGERYLTVRAWGVVAEGEPSPAFYTFPKYAVESWLKAVLALRFDADCRPQQTLYWYKKPTVEKVGELESGVGRPIELYDIWSRLLISDKPPIASDQEGM
jgi:hypothetical protein